VAKFAAAGPGERNLTFLQVAPPVLRLMGVEGADMLRAAYTGDDDQWLETALKGAMEKYVGAADDAHRKCSVLLGETAHR
jgi:hypothetical protein